MESEVEGGKERRSLSIKLICRHISYYSRRSYKIAWPTIFLTPHCRYFSQTYTRHASLDVAIRYVASEGGSTSSDATDRRRNFAGCAQPSETSGRSIPLASFHSLLPFTALSNFPKTLCQANRNENCPCHAVNNLFTITTNPG